MIFLEVMTVIQLDLGNSPWQSTSNSEEKYPMSRSDWERLGALMSHFEGMRPAFYDCSALEY